MEYIYNVCVEEIEEDALSSYINTQHPLSEPIVKWILCINKMIQTNGNTFANMCDLILKSFEIG